MTGAIFPCIVHAQMIATRDQDESLFSRACWCTLCAPCFYCPYQRYKTRSKFQIDGFILCDVLACFLCYPCALVRLALCCSQFSRTSWLQAQSDHEILHQSELDYKDWKMLQEAMEFRWQPGVDLTTQAQHSREASKSFVDKHGQHSRETSKSATETHDHDGNASQEHGCCNFCGDRCSTCKPGLCACLVCCDCCQQRCCKCCQRMEAANSSTSTETQPPAQSMS